MLHPLMSGTPCCDVYRFLCDNYVKQPLPEITLNFFTVKVRYIFFRGQYVIMKTKAVFFTVCAVMLALVLCIAPAAAEDSITDKVITVAGYGVSETTPDMATITLGIETENTDAAKAIKENNEKMNKVISALKSAGIASQDIRTNQYSVYSSVISEYNEGKYKAGTTVYHVTNTVSAITRDMDTIGSVIDKAADAGANRVNSLQFSLSDEKQIQERKNALTSAVKAARADAEAVAGALGVSLRGTGVVSVDRSYNPVSYASYDMEMPAPMVEATSYNTKAVAGGSSIEAGTLKTTATVSITYLY